VTVELTFSLLVGSVGEIAAAWATPSRAMPSQARRVAI
jgi:hypothetical protein